MKENFDFYAAAKLPSGEHSDRVHVVVKGATISIHSVKNGRLATGVWDAGAYVCYPRSHEVPLPPQLLDEIDGELRLRMTAQGIQKRATPRRRSAIGY